MRSSEFLLEDIHSQIAAIKAMLARDSTDANTRKAAEGRLKILLAKLDGRKIDDTELSDKDHRYKNKPEKRGKMVDITVEDIAKGDQYRVAFRVKTRARTPEVIEDALIFYEPDIYTVRKRAKAQLLGTYPPSIYSVKILYIDVLGKDHLYHSVD
jgi:hypothetical protein